MINEQGRRFAINVAEDMNALDKRLRQVEVNGIALSPGALSSEAITIPATEWKKSTFPYAAVNFAREYKYPVVNFQIVGGGSREIYANILSISNNGAVVRTNASNNELSDGTVKITVLVSEKA